METVNLIEAAKWLDLEPLRIVTLIKQGELGAVCMDPILIPEQEIITYIVEVQL